MPFVFVCDNFTEPKFCFTQWIVTDHFHSYLFVLFQSNSPSLSTEICQHDTHSTHRNVVRPLQQSQAGNSLPSTTRWGSSGKPDSAVLLWDKKTTAPKFSTVYQHRRNLLLVNHVQLRDRQYGSYCQQKHATPRWAVNDHINSGNAHSQNVSLTLLSFDSRAAVCPVSRLFSSVLFSPLAVTQSHIAMQPVPAPKFEHCLFLRSKVHSVAQADSHSLMYASQYPEEKLNRVGITRFVVAARE